VEVYTAVLGFLRRAGRGLGAGFSMKSFFISSV